MKPALLLVDLQEDFLNDAGLRPHRAQLVARAAALLLGFRAAGVPVVHVRTTVRRDPDDRMPHWRASGEWTCEEGTPGHEAPGELASRGGEPVVEKRGYSPFVESGLGRVLQELGVDTVCLSGVHLHACVRATALDAYQRGLEVWIAEDAVGSREPLHGDETRRYLEKRAIRFLSVDRALGALGPTSSPAPEAGPAHVSPRRRSEVLWRVPIAQPGDVDDAARAAAGAQQTWQPSPPGERAEILERVCEALEARREGLARQMAREVGKPLGDGLGEVGFAIALVRSASERARAQKSGETGPDWEARRRPLGVVAVVTPFNNPLAVPLGKIAPALLYGNGVLWKPAPAGTGVARAIQGLLSEAGAPPGLVGLVCGDRATAEQAMSHPSVDAVALTGSEAAGVCGQAICASRHVPFQAELGGNNAAIVWSDCDLERAATELAAGAFGFAGQRCTANRRAVVDGACLDAFLERLRAAVAGLAWGDPLLPETRVGPLISEAAQARVRAVVERAGDAGHPVWRPPDPDGRAERLAAEGFYLAPALVRCDDASHEIVQEESFGPVLVVQRAEDFEHALALQSGVRQGLVAALFSPDAKHRERFLARAEAGILKLDASTAGASAEAPFIGWKGSGVGPAEHGAGDPEFYTRPQAVYG